MKVIYTHVNPNDITRKLVRNPNYPGEPTSIAGCVSIPLTPAPNKAGFFAALERSIKRDGIRNPPLLYQSAEGIFLGFGGSRVIAAQRAGLTRIPAIINSHASRGRVPAADGAGDAHVVKQVTPRNFSTFFKDPPEWVEWTELGVDYHYSIEKNRRANYDHAGLRWVDTLDEDDKSFLPEEFPWLKL